jgi:hypothetical protein
VARLRKAHAYFAERDGEAVWGDWLGGDVLWARVREKLEATGAGDWRVSTRLNITWKARADHEIRLLLHRGGEIEVQALPAPTDAGGLYHSSQVVSLTPRSIHTPA